MGNLKNTRLSVYGKHSHCTLEELENLEQPKKLIWWCGTEKINEDRTMNIDELFLSSELLSKEEEEANGLIYLGKNDFQLFYMTEEINGNYFTYVTDDPNGPGDLLYPVTWSKAKICLMKSKNTNELSIISRDDSKVWSQVFANLQTLGFLGLCTRDVALKNGVGIGNPIDDPNNSELTKQYLDELMEKINQPDDDSDDEVMAAGL